MGIGAGAAVGDGVGDWGLGLYDEAFQAWCNPKMAGPALQDTRTPTRTCPRALAPYLAHVRGGLCHHHCPSHVGGKGEAQDA